MANDMAERDVVIVNAIFSGDCMALLLPVLGADSMREVAGKVAEHVVGTRVRPRNAAMIVSNRLGEDLAPELTVRQAGIGPLDAIRVRYAD